MHAVADHTLNIDLRRPADGPAARVGMELTADSARALAESILRVLDEVARSTEPLSLHLRGAGTFEDRILFAGVGGDAEALRRLSAGTAEAASDVGLDAWTSPTHSGPIVQTRQTQVRYILYETAALLYYRTTKASADGIGITEDVAADK